MNLKDLLLSFVLIILSFQVFPQSQKRALETVAKERKEFYKRQSERAKQYAAEHNIPLKFTDDKGNQILMIGVDEGGLPVYLTTFNAEASVTTGTASLHAGGGMGLNLTGEGIKVGVWDGGKVKLSHVEFGGRILSVQGDAESSHATHVTGTILAAGVQPDAKGMAPGASATTWYYDNDDVEMAALATPDQSTLLFSNHSYGTLVGWYNNNGTWSWTGNSAISSAEDYRFGFYTAKSRVIDEIAFNAPYYSIVWAAGNDRMDVGDGTTFPHDGNGGTGYDCLHPDAVAKNVITVGAVEKITNYTGPSSVAMAGFSSWGPTDDGRIKPDLVGVGVGVLSTDIATSTAYSIYSGTSMAAPNVTGSLVLLQQLYSDLHAGNYMKAATLKALAIHTAKEAGSFPGPDYSFGWGLVDAKAAAQLLLAQDQRSVILSENTLSQGQVFEFDISPQQDTKITATIVWTDPAGTPVSASLDPSATMLVNDLDVRLVDDAENEVYPWILDPANPSFAATTGDNFRDNVEKIEFAFPEQRTYKVRVSHKGTLLNSQQDFSLILTYTPIGDTRTAYYWVGDSGDWSTSGNWSLSSGGSSVPEVPDQNSRVIFDENSFSGTDKVVTLSSDASCGSFTWLAKNNASLSLNGHTLRVQGNLIVSPYQFSVASSGVIELSGSFSSASQINLGGTDLSKADLVINSADNVTWVITGEVNAGSIELLNGNLMMSGANIHVESFASDAVSNRTIDMTGAIINDVSSIVLSGQNLTLNSEGSVIRLKPSSSTTIDWEDVVYDGSILVQQGQLELTGDATVENIEVEGTLKLFGNNLLRNFTATGGATIQLEPGSQQSFTNNIALNATAADRITISTTAPGEAQMLLAGHFKKCFDYMDISGVDLVHDDFVTISAGLNSTLLNADNWIGNTCEDALFPDFSIQYNCEGARTEFINLSEGDIVSYSWDFGDLSSGENTSTEENPHHIYATSGTYTVQLTVSDATSSKTYTAEVEIGENDLEPNKVVVTDNKLYSFLLASEYQWYRNNEPIEGAVSRSYDYNGDDGTYFVLVKSESCNIPSSAFVVSSIIDEEVNGNNNYVTAFPNPVTRDITVQVHRELLPAKLSLVNMVGQAVYTTVVTTESLHLNMENIPSGLYVLNVESKGIIKNKQLVSRK